MGATNDDDGPQPADVLALFGSICDRTTAVIAATTDWRKSGRSPGQYLVDLHVDEVCVPPLLDAGFAVLSEETGLGHPPDAGGRVADQGVGASRHVVIVDPLDGSTNASLGLPWCNTALCLVSDGVPEVAMVANVITGERFQAVRGSGATLDGEPIRVADERPLARAVVAVNGAMSRPLGWRQYRAMGAAELDICHVARGSFDAFVDLTPGRLGVWDYLAGMLIVTEAGGVMADALGRDLVVIDHEARRAPVAASGPALLDEVIRARDAAAAG